MLLLSDKKVEEHECREVCMGENQHHKLIPNLTLSLSPPQTSMSHKTRSLQTELYVLQYVFNAIVWSLTTGHSAGTHTPSASVAFQYDRRSIYLIVAKVIKYTYTSIRLTMEENTWL